MASRPQAHALSDLLEHVRRLDDVHSTAHLGQWRARMLGDADDRAAHGDDLRALAPDAHGREAAFDYLLPLLEVEVGEVELVEEDDAMLALVEAGPRELALDGGHVDLFAHVEMLCGQQPVENELGLARVRGAPQVERRRRGMPVGDAGVEPLLDLLLD